MVNKKELERLFKLCQEIKEESKKYYSTLFIYINPNNKFKDKIMKIIKEYRVDLEVVMTANIKEDKVLLMPKKNLENYKIKFRFEDN